MSPPARARSRRMLDELGAVIIDADVLAREVVAKGTPGLEAVVEEFGEELLAADGELDRPAMGRLVFSDEQARKRLEAIVHPLVFERIVELEAGGAAPTRSSYTTSRCWPRPDAPATFDAVIVVDAPPEVQVERMTARPRLDRRGRRVADRGAGLPGGPAGDRHARHREHRDARRPPQAGCGGLRGGGLGGSRTTECSGRPGPPSGLRPAQAARSGSARRRSFAIASRSSWRTRSAEMPWRAPMSASLCWRPSTRP